MLSNRQKKYVNALKQKKNRTSSGLFVVEGVKMVQELLLSDYKFDSIFASSLWIENNEGIECFEVSDAELKSISSLKNPNHVLAVVQKKESSLLEISSQLNIAMDSLQDPGNFGTIIRTADWFGVKNIICSEEVVDVFNPKVLQATMGSFFRVNIIYTNLIDFFKTNKELTVYGALLDGENVYQKNLKKNGSVILLGNESKGISESLKPYITHKVSIPNFGKAESLNVATASAVFCSEFMRT